MQIGVSLPSRRALAVPVEVQWRLAVAGIFVVSAVARTLAGWRHVTPTYFPDENTYASLSRSISAGHLPSVRGHVAHFPALLEPILTAPAWWFGLATGYRVTQAIGALAMSTTALIVWWGVRRLGGGRGPALAAAALAVAVPDVAYSGWILSEPFAYPLFTAASFAAAPALARPTRRAQALFVTVALAATFARLQLVLLVPAYFVAALLLRRVRAQRLVAVGLAVALAAVGVAVVGFYHGATLHAVSATEVGRTLMVLALAGGWAVVPAGLLGLTLAWRRPERPEQRAFAVFSAVAGVAVLVTAVGYANASQVHERYGFYVLPLLFTGFALLATRGWPWQRAHAALAAPMILVASTVTLASWSGAHSLTLLGMLRLQQLTGSAGAAGLLVAAAAGLASLLAVGFAWRRWTVGVAALALVFTVAGSALATSFDAQNSRLMRERFLPAGPAWVAGPATIVVGDAARPDAFSQLFWDPGLTALAVFPRTAIPDTFAATSTAIAQGGTLVGLHGRVVLDESAAALVPAAPPLRTNGDWVEARTAQVAAALYGRYSDGWLAPHGVVRLYRAGVLRFTVTAPVPTRMTIGGRTIRLAQGVPTRVVVACSTAYRFSTAGSVGPHLVSASATFPVWARGAARC